MKENQIEIIKKVRAIENEMSKRRGLDRLVNYNSGEVVHKKQMEFHKCDKKNRWVFGGNRTGKTECGAVETVWLLRGIHPYKKNKPDVTGWVVSVSYEVQREVAQQKILSYLSPDWILDVVMQQGRKDSLKNGVIDTIVVKNVFGGTSRLSFKSADQGREKFQGASLDFVWFDEEPPKDIYEECVMRVLDRCGEIYCTMTPLKGLTWVYDEIYLNVRQNPEIWYEQMEWKDNPYLDENEVENLSPRRPTTCRNRAVSADSSRKAGLCILNSTRTCTLSIRFPSRASGSAIFQSTRDLKIRCRATFTRWTATV